MCTQNEYIIKFNIGNCQLDIKLNKIVLSSAEISEEDIIKAIRMYYEKQVKHDSTIVFAHNVRAYKGNDKDTPCLTLQESLQLYPPIESDYHQ